MLQQYFACCCLGARSVQVPLGQAGRSNAALQPGCVCECACPRLGPAQADYLAWQGLCLTSDSTGSSRENEWQAAAHTERGGGCEPAWWCTAGALRACFFTRHVPADCPEACMHSSYTPSFSNAHGTRVAQFGPAQAHKTARHSCSEPRPRAHAPACIAEGRPAPLVLLKRPCTGSAPWSSGPARRVRCQTRPRGSTGTCAGSRWGSVWRGARGCWAAASAMRCRQEQQQGKPAAQTGEGASSLVSVRGLAGRRCLAAATCCF